MNGEFRTKEESLEIISEQMEKITEILSDILDKISND